MESREAEMAKVIKFTDRFIASGNPVKVAFWLGYRRGIKHRLLGGESVGPFEGHLPFSEVAQRGHSDRFVDAYVHGYQNGIDGRPPEEILGEWEG